MPASLRWWILGAAAVSVAAVISLLPGPRAPSRTPSAQRATKAAPAAREAQARAAEELAASDRSESAGGAIDRSAIAPAESRHESSRDAAHERALAVARSAETRETMNRAQIRSLLVDSFAVMLPEQRFSDADYEAMTDAVLSVRAARRALAALPVSEGSAQVLAGERAQLTDALAELERITGINPSTYPEVLDPDAGISRDDETNEEEVVHEPLSKYPPPTPPATAAPRP